MNTSRCYNLTYGQVALLLHSLCAHEKALRKDMGQDLSKASDLGHATNISTTYFQALDRVRDLRKALNVPVSGVE